MITHFYCVVRYETSVPYLMSDPDDERTMRIVSPSLDTEEMIGVTLAQDSEPLSASELADMAEEPLRETLSRHGRILEMRWLFVERSGVCA